MRTVPVLLACCSAIALGPAPPPPSNSADVAAILEAEREICAAFEREDADWLEAHLDPSFTLVNSTGKVTTAADEVADLRAGTRYDVFRNRDSNVRVYGDAAVVTGITRVEGGEGDARYAIDFRFTDTYLRRPTGWVIVASHASRMDPQPPREAAASAAAPAASMKGSLSETGE